MNKDYVRKKEEKSAVKSRKKVFIYVIVAIFCVFLIYELTTYILTATSVINQGFFRINDFVITSKVNVQEDVKDKVGANEVDIYAAEDEVETDIKNNLEVKLNISQENIFSILITKSDVADIKRIYLDNIKIVGINKEIYSSGANGEETVVNSLKQLDLELKEADNQYLIEFALLNKNIVENVEFPEGTNTVIYDGTILKTIGYNLQDMSYTFKARLNIVDSTEKVSVCDINVKLPTGNLGENGIVIERQNLERYNLKLKNKILEILG